MLNVVSTTSNYKSSPNNISNGLIFILNSIFESFDEQKELALPRRIGQKLFLLIHEPICVLSLSIFDVENEN